MTPTNRLFGRFVETNSTRYCFREETNSAQYGVIISVKNKLLDSDNNEVDIYPGMIAQVDIIETELFWNIFGNQLQKLKIQPSRNRLVFCRLLQTNLIF